MSLPDVRRKGWEPLPQETLIAAIEANPGDGFPWIIAPRGVAPEQRINRRRMFLAFALRATMQASLNAGGPRFASLPVPVRHRAAGTHDCWNGVREEAGEDGVALWSKLEDARCSPSRLRHDLSAFSACHLGRARPDDVQLDAWATEGALVQSYWLRQGALYEPTVALHQLLAASDVASDVPLSMLRLPSPAVCITPDPSTRERAGLDAVMVFEHGNPDDPDTGRWLTFGIWKRSEAGEFRLRLQVLSANAGAGARSVDAILSGGVGEGDGDTGKDEVSRQALDYAIKVLLYLSLDSSPVIHERPYSTAPREFRGLGKRRREERLADIERLYDRYLVGPVVLPDGLSRAAGRPEGAHHELRAHGRRGHFRMQPYGPAASQRKLIFVMPTLVRADRLGDDLGESQATTGDIAL